MKVLYKIWWVFRWLLRWKNWLNMVEVVWCIWCWISDLIWYVLWDCWRLLRVESCCFLVIVVLERIVNCLICLKCNLFFLMMVIMNIWVFMGKWKYIVISSRLMSCILYLLIFGLKEKKIWILLLFVLCWRKVIIGIVNMVRFFRWLLLFLVLLWENKLMMDCRVIWRCEYLIYLFCEIRVNMYFICVFFWCRKLLNDWWILWFGIIFFLIGCDGLFGVFCVMCMMEKWVVIFEFGRMYFIGMCLLCL